MKKVIIAVLLTFIIIVAGILSLLTSLAGIPEVDKEEE